MSVSSQLIASAIAERREALFTDVRSHVRQTLASMSPRETLTFRLMEGEIERRVIAPSASEDYVRSLIAFTRGKTYLDRTVDSAVTPRTMEAVSEAVLRFYASEAISGVIAQSIMDQIERSEVANHAARELTAENARWLKKELVIATHLQGAHSIAGQAVDAAAGAVQQFFHTAVGANILAVLAKVMSTAGGKLMVTKGLQLAVGKVMASAAAKTMIVSVIKKVGIGVLLKTVIGKAVVGAFAAVGLAHVPLVWILLPLIAAFLVYEYQSFPSKLADKVPAEVERVLLGEFDTLNRSVSEAIVVAVLSQAADYVTEVHTE